MIQSSRKFPLQKTSELIGNQTRVLSMNLQNIHTFTAVAIWALPEDL